MWWFKRKEIQKMHQAKEDEVQKIKAETERRTTRATKPIQRLAERLEENGITLQIRKGLGNKHV